MATETQSLVPENVYRELRQNIINQAHAPDSLITEALVVEQFGVSRPTARAAIERLVAEGILRREAHRAARVPLLSEDDIRDLYATRTILECSAGETLAGIGVVPANAALAHRALVAHPHDFADHDIAFHRALVAGQPSPRLVKLHELLMGEIELCIGQVQVAGLMTPAVVAAQHQSILDAITAGDPDAATRHIGDHLAGARDSLLTHASSATDRGRASVRPNP